MSIPEKLQSRKLAVTAFILIATTALAYFKALTPEVAGVFTALGVAYNAGQAYVDGKSG